MIQFICYFFPALIAVRFDKDLKKQKSVDLIDFILGIALYTVVINGVIYAVLFLFTVHRYRFFSPAHFNVSFALQYLVFGGVLSWVVPNCLNFIRSHMEFNVTVTRK